MAAQVKSLEALTPFAIPLPRPAKVNRKPIALGVEQEPKPTSRPIESVEPLKNRFHVPAPLLQVALGA